MKTTTDKIKVRCSVCSDGVAVEGNCVAKHNHKYTHKYTGAKVICYGSFLPVFVDNKGLYQVGNVMYISRRKQTFDEPDAEEPLEQLQLTSGVMPENEFAWGNNQNVRPLQTF